MNISLTPELDNYVQEKVKTGLYHSASEVIREGLRLLQEQDMLRQVKLEQLRRELAIGDDQLKQGQYKDYDSDGLRRLAEEIKMEGRRRLDAHRADKE